MERSKYGNVQWSKWIEELKSWKATHGNLDIPIDTVLEDGKLLGVWFDTQKHKYQKGKLTGAQKAELDSIGVPWKRELADWEEGFSHAEACFKENGTVQIPSDYVCRDGFPLGKWLDEQCIQHQSIDYNHDWENRLGALGIVWSRSCQRMWISRPRGITRLA